MLIEKLFNTGEIDINYAEGPDNGPPLVLLHGSSLNWQTFGGLIELLSRTWHVYACDLRGHGKSGRATSGYRAVDFIPDALAFIEKHVKQPTVILGFSTGAVVSLGVAAALPKLVRAIVLLDPSLMLRDVSIKSASPFEWFVWLDKVLQSAHSIDEAVSMCKTHDPAMSDADAQGQAGMVFRIDPASVTTILSDRLMDGFDLESMLSKVACPMQLLYGEQDKGSVIRPIDIELVNRNFREGVIVQIEGAGHGVHWEQPAKVEALISVFLATV